MQTVIFDFETTGLNPQTDFPTEIAMRKISSTGKVTDYTALIKLPEGVEVPAFITNLTGLTTEKLQAEGKDIDVVYMEMLNFLGKGFEESTVFVAHNANFDLGYLAVHFNIYPEHYVCTRTIAILTDPSKNASLQAVYNDLFPDKNTIQEHRALGDIEMTQEVLEYYMNYHGEHAVSFFINKLVAMPDRELVFVPPHAQVLDFSKQYVAKRKYDELKHRMDGLEK